MNRKMFVGILFTLFLASMLTMTFNVQPAKAKPPTIVSFFPSNILGPPPSLGKNFTVYINIENVTDLYTYEIGFSWNVTVLNCLSWTYNTTFFPPDMTAPGEIDNVAGKTDTAYGATLTYPPHEFGINGSGTLADVKFKVVGYGKSWINFTTCNLLDSPGYYIQRDLVNNTFLLLPPTSGPTAAFTYSPTAPTVNETVTFNASGSLPGWNGTHFMPIVNYMWVFGDGSTGSGMIVNHTYDWAGSYTVILNVKDSQGLWNATSKKITVEMIFEDELVVLPWVAHTPTHYDPTTGIYPTELEIRTDLQLLYNTGFLGVITYGSQNSLRHVPRIAREVGFQGVIMGIWSPTDSSEKQNAKSVAEYVDGYCVGNEGLYFGRYNLATLEAAMEEMREDTSKPVTTTEPIGYYSNLFMREIGDWYFPNVHPYWAGKKEPVAAVDWTVAQFNWLKSLDPHKPILFKEVGLPTADDPECSEARQAEYYRLLQRTTVPFAFFESFDQPWKHEYVNGYDIGPHWGLFRNNRSPKEVVKYLGRGTCFPTDGQGNVKNTFAVGAEIYVKGYGFPIDTQVNIYLIPDGTSFIPNNSKASASRTTDSLRNLPTTFIWEADGTEHLDIWIDVGQNGFRDKFDVVNDESLNTYPINVVPELTDVAIINITPFSFQAYPNWTTPMEINVTMRNEGSFIENNIIVTLHWNSTNIIGTKNVTLNVGETKNVTFTWTIPTIPFAWPYPIYILSANATLPGDSDPEDNTLTDGAVTVSWPGDATGSPIPSPPDGHVWVEDLYLFGKAWGSKRGQARYNQRVDFDNDGHVWVGDLFILGKNWGRNLR